MEDMVVLLEGKMAARQGVHSGRRKNCAWATLYRAGAMAGKLAEPMA
jgi:hypothetical protein